MSAPASPRSNSASDTELLKISKSIKTRRNNQKKSIFGLIDDIDKLRSHTDPGQLLIFLRDCGLSDDEASTYSQFTPRLSAYRSRLEQFPLGFDAIKALVNSDTETVGHALAALETDMPIGASELGWLRQVAEASKISDYEDEMDAREQRLQTACLAIATRRMATFEKAVGHLHNLMVQHSKQRSYLIDYEGDLRDEEFAEDLTAEQVAELYRNWPKVEANGAAFLEQKEQEIVTAASGLLREFDQLFPGAMIPMESWLDVTGSDRNFAESRHALEILTRGAFWGGFPAVHSSQHQWDSLDSIAFLAGIKRKSPVSKRLAPRPVKKFNAITMEAGSGADAIGLDLAGFRIRTSYFAVSSGAATIKANRRDWTPATMSIDDHALATHMLQAVGDGGRVGLLAGPLPGEPFTEKRKGENDKAQRFTRAFRILADIQPDAFFFESSADFLGLRHTAFRNRLIEQASELGYKVANIVTLDAKNFGVVQDRKRSIFVGVRASAEGHLQGLTLAEPLRRTVGEIVADAAFPHLQAIRAMTENERTPAQSKYLWWANNWLRTYGSKSSVPDTLTLLKPRRSPKSDDHWRDEYGLSVGSDEIVEPHEDLKYRPVPLSIPILKRLQGIPDDWVVVGTYDEQAEQICRTIPPVISRVLAHNIHGAISGEIVDLGLAARMEIKSNRWLGGFRGPSLERSVDPRASRSQAWNRHLAGDDDS